MYSLIKILHASCAVISLLFFAIRGYRFVCAGALPRNFLNKVLPHIIDTVLLASAIALVVMSRQYPLVSPWVTAKIVALLIYIGLGIALMRSHQACERRLVIYGLALLTGTYILLVALSKNPLPLPI